MAAEEADDRVEFAHLTDVASHVQGVFEFRDHQCLRVTCGQFRHADEVEREVLFRFQLGCRQSGDDGPRWMLDQVVVGVRSDEGREFRDGGEPVEVFLMAEKRFPLVVALAPAGCPQSDEVSVGESDFDRDDVSSHGRKLSTAERKA